jgi:hypothetical protein
MHDGPATFSPTLGLQQIELEVAAKDQLEM